MLNRNVTCSLLIASVTALGPELDSPLKRLTMFLMMLWVLQTIHLLSKLARWIAARG